MILHRLFTTMAGLLYSGLVLAEAETGKTAVANMDPLSMGSLVQVMLGLFVILGVILGGAFLLRRLGYWQLSSNGAMKIVGGLAMGPREKIVLLQVGKRQLVLGVTPGRIQTLCEMDENVLPEVDQDLPASAFQRKLMQFINKDSQNSVQ